jgi:hypothetical protein
LIEWVPTVADDDRVAVGRRFRDCIGACVAAGARLVVDDDRLAPGRLQLLADQAREDVGGTTGP